MLKPIALEASTPHFEQMYQKKDLHSSPIAPRKISIKETSCGELYLLLLATASDAFIVTSMFEACSAGIDEASCGGISLGGSELQSLALLGRLYILCKPKA